MDRPGVPATTDGEASEEIEKAEAEVRELDAEPSAALRQSPPMPNRWRHRRERQKQLMHKAAEEDVEIPAEAEPEVAEEGADAGEESPQAVEEGTSREAAEEVDRS